MFFAAECLEQLEHCIREQRTRKSVGDASTSNKIENISTDMIIFASKQLEEFQPRDDYKELLNLCIIFSGGVPKKGLSFRSPGGHHRARWMAKAIYSLKIYLFRGQFKLTKKEYVGICDICIFTVRIYIKYWFQAATAIYSPRNNLQLLKDLKKYEEVNVMISKKAMKKFLGHLWYLSEELIAFAFFDENVSSETKRNMVVAMQNEGTEHPVKRISLEPDIVLRKNLEDFVTDNTRKFFDILGISSQFFNKDVDHWDEDEDYKKSKAIVQSMRVVNDIAERGVALMEEYNKLHTTNEEQKQFLLLLIKQFRQKYPDRKKSTLIL